MKNLVITLLVLVAVLSASIIGYLYGRAVHKVEVKEIPIQSIDSESELAESPEENDTDEVLHFIGEVEFRIINLEED